MAGSNTVRLAVNASASTSAVATVPGGYYALMGRATWGGGSAVLQVSDGLGWIPFATLSADGMVNVQIPSGQVRAVITTASAVYLTLVSIPTSRN